MFNCLPGAMLTFAAYARMKKGFNCGRALLYLNAGGHSKSQGIQSGPTGGSATLFLFFGWQNSAKPFFAHFPVLGGTEAPPPPRSFVERPSGACYYPERVAVTP